MRFKRGLPWWLLLGGMAGLATFSVAQIAETMMERAGVGSYWVTFSAPDAKDELVYMFASFFKDGIVQTNDGTDEGVVPDQAARRLAEACGGPNAQIAGAPRPGERESPGHGAWSRKRQTVFFTILSQRFDAEGKPTGWLRARGQGRAAFDGAIRGDSTIEFFDLSQDPTSGRSVPACAVDAVFAARRIPSVVEIGQDEFPDDNPKDLRG